MPQADPAQEPGQAMRTRAYLCHRGHVRWVYGSKRRVTSCRQDAQDEYGHGTGPCGAYQRPLDLDEEAAYLLGGLEAIR